MDFGEEETKMNSYLLIILADVLLTADFVFQKKYQKTAGTTVKASLVFNALQGVLCAVGYLIINKFRVHITIFSVVMAVLFALLVISYIIIGFKIMENGNMSLYTLFLMAGGMTVPFVWGVVFWQEQISVWRVLGLFAIAGALVISNSGGKKPDRRQILLCVAVFFLNGFASVVAKMHQISEAGGYVTSADFGILAKVATCLLALLILSGKGTCVTQEKLPAGKVVIISALSAVAGGLSFFLQLIGAVSVPATVLYPLITGGSVILSSLAGLIVYKEKITKSQWLAIAICFVGTLLFL